MWRGNWAQPGGVRHHSGQRDKLRIVASLDDIAGGRRVWTQGILGVQTGFADDGRPDLQRAWWKPWRWKPSNEEMARATSLPRKTLSLRFSI